MMTDFVLMISDLQRASGPFKLTLKLDQVYANVWKAMGIWSVENPAANIASGYSSEDTHHARWFWDTHKKKSN